MLYPSKCLLPILALFVFSSNLLADVVIDQSSGFTLAGSFNANSTTTTWQQEVDVGVTGQLVGVDILPAVSGNGVDSTFFFINDGSPWQSDANLFETVVEVPASWPNDWFYVDVSSANIQFSAGDSFVWGVSGIDGGLNLRGHSNLNYSGELWVDTQSLGIREYTLFGQTADLSFRTHMDVVPEPSVCLLLTFSVIGLCMFRIRL